MIFLRNLCCSTESSDGVGEELVGYGARDRLQHLAANSVLTPRAVFSKNLESINTLKTEEVIRSMNPYGRTEKLKRGKYC